MIHITSNSLSIPPYVSTAWKNILSIYTRLEGEARILVLVMDQTSTDIPDLDADTIANILNTYADYINNDQKSSKDDEEDANQQKEQANGEDMLKNLFSFSQQFFPVTIDALQSGISTICQPLLKHQFTDKLPIMDQSLLEKLYEMIKMFHGSAETFSEPATPNCHCLYCQLASHIQKENPTDRVFSEPIEEELNFPNWAVKKLEPSVYTVHHMDAPDVAFTVCLGSSIGCTCGDKDCVHIKIVLSSSE